MKPKKKQMRAMGGPAKSSLGKPARYAAGGKADGHWIEKIGMKKNALHKEMGIPAGKKIPEKKLDKAANSSNPLLAKRASLAKTLKKLH